MTSKVVTFLTTTVTELQSKSEKSITYLRVQILIVLSKINVVLSLGRFNLNPLILMVILEPKLWADENPQPQPQPWLLGKPIKMLQLQITVK